MTFTQRRNRLTRHFTERIRIVKRRMTIETLDMGPCRIKA